jgi:hypothetical protein
MDAGSAESGGATDGALALPSLVSFGDRGNEGLTCLR